MTLLDEWRADVTRRLLAIMAALAVILTALFRASLTPVSGVGALAIIIVLTALVAWRTAPIGARLVVIQASMSFAAATALYTGRDPGAAGMYLVTGVVLTALLAGSLVTWLYIAFATGLLLLAAWALVSGTTLMDPAPVILAPPMMMLGNAITLAGVGLLLVTSLRSQTRRMIVALAERERAVDDLRRESRERERSFVALRDAHTSLEQAQASLLEASKLELLGQLAGGIAHDMNNALTVVLAEADLLERDAPGRAQAIADAVEHASTLTRQLLAIGRREVVQPRPIALDEAVHGAAAMLRRTLPRTVELQTKLAAGVVVRADANQIRQIVLNLGANAAHAVADGGAITITVTADADRARLVVADDGHGIAPETLAHIFEPFFTTKAEGVGTGLGLPSVKAIVEALDGAVTCESEVGIGTRFTVELPRTDELADRSDPPALGRAAAAARLDGRRILVVDDEVRVRAMVATALQAAGASVVDVGHAEAAIALAERAAEPFDLLWTDVVLPGGGGKAVVAHFAAHSPTTRIVISTGYADNQVLIDELARGRYTLVRKPFAQAELLEVTGRLLGAPPAGSS